jgi:hypothetical protein
MPDIRIAEAILALHLAVIAFNVAGLIVIPVGAWRGWRIVRIAWLRLLHLALLGVVAAQALAGRACILTIWQNDLTHGPQPAEPLIMRWVDGLIYWNLPMGFFDALYVAVFLYVVVLVLLAPFWRRGPDPG